MASVLANMAMRPLRVAAIPNGISGDCFLKSDADSLKREEYMNEIAPVKEQVRMMVMDDSINHKEKLDFINVVCRLGVSYYFEKEIQHQLESIFEEFNYENNYDLYTVGVHFRIFRQHGYKITIDVFNKFKNSDGSFQESLKGDVKGILSLYEAAHLGMRNEGSMDEALHFTTRILRSIESESELEDQCLYNQVVHATKQALHLGIRRIETRDFIIFYEEEASDHNETLVRFAKLDFNMLQLLHRQELTETVKWWKKLDLKAQLPYIRDRSLECHFWSLGLFYEPQFSRFRQLMTKIYLAITVLDDTYDSYGTFEELHLLTQAFERWDNTQIEELSDKIRVVFNFVFNMYEELKKEMESEGRGFAFGYAKQSMIDLIRAYYTEAEWAHKKYIPSLEEYLCRAGRMTSCTQPLVLSGMLVLDSHIASAKAFEWVVNPVPLCVRGLEVIGRFMNDLVSHQEEQKRILHVASSVQCYTNEHGVSEEEAIAAIWRMVMDGWKDMNEELVKPIPVSPFLVQLVLNLGRLMDVNYKHKDGFTYSDQVLKQKALLLYAQSFPV